MLHVTDDNIVVKTIRDIVINAVIDDSNTEIKASITPEIVYQVTLNQPTGVFSILDFENAFAQQTTNDLTEGNLNQYFTDTRAQDALAGMYEVPLTFTSGVGRTLNVIKNVDKGSTAVSTHEGTYDHDLIATALQDLTSLTTDNLSEGSTNKYDKTVQISAGNEISVSGSYPAFIISYTGEAGSNDKVRYDANDPTAGFVVDKIIAGSGISLTEGIGANENKLVITNTGIIVDATADSKQYARKNNTWSEVVIPSGMVYPASGISYSRGTSWGTSITNNSTNWNTAYGWGNHASVGYLTSLSGALLLDQTTPQTTTGTFYFNSVLINETSPYDNSCVFEANGKGGFNDGAMSIYFAGGTGNVLNANGGEATFMNDPTSVYLAGLTVAGTFNNSQQQVYLADGVYGVKAIGASNMFADSEIDLQGPEQPTANYFLGSVPNNVNRLAHYDNNQSTSRTEVSFSNSAGLGGWSDNFVSFMVHGAETAFGNVYIPSVNGKTTDGGWSYIVSQGTVQQGFGIVTYHPTPIVLGTDNIPRIYIDGTTGNVSIGTSIDNGYKLNILGSTFTKGTPWVDIDIADSLIGRWGHSYNQAHLGTNSYLDFRSPLATGALEFWAGDGTEQLNFNGGSFRFYTSQPGYDTDVTGNVLINVVTDNTIDKLQVNGSAYFSSGLNDASQVQSIDIANRVLKSNGGGNTLDYSDGNIRTANDVYANSVRAYSLYEEVGSTLVADLGYRQLIAADETTVMVDWSGPSLSLVPISGNVLIGSDVDNGIDRLQVYGSEMIKLTNDTYDLSTGQPHLRLENTGSQTLMTFTFSDAIAGGVRSDSVGNFNWHATGPQGHQFYNALSPYGGTMTVGFGGLGLYVGNSPGAIPTTHHLEVVGTPVDDVYSNLAKFSNALGANVTIDKNGKLDAQNMTINNVEVATKAFAIAMAVAL